MHISYYDSPLGSIILYSDGKYLTGLYFTNNKYEKENGCHILDETKRWLDIYFSAKEVSFTPPYRLEGTAFQKEVWSYLEKIPYGTTITYGEIAKSIAKKRGIKKMSARAVGNAIGNNPISIIVPCHRVIGSKGKLTGYGGGIDKKIFLLQTEGIDTSAFHI